MSAPAAPFHLFLSYARRDDERPVNAVGEDLRQSRPFLASLSPNFITSRNCYWNSDEYRCREPFTDRHRWLVRQPGLTTAQLDVAWGVYAGCCRTEPSTLGLDKCVRG